MEIQTKTQDGRVNTNRSEIDISVLEALSQQGLAVISPLNDAVLKKLKFTEFQLRSLDHFTAKSFDATRSTTNFRIAATSLSLSTPKHAKMCGRYALSLRPAEVRQQFQDSNMPSHDAPEDEDVRQSYNFAPGYHGLVYRADTPDFGGGRRPQEDRQENEDGAQEDDTAVKEEILDESDKEVHYKLQSMKWGTLAWDKRFPRSLLIVHLNHRLNTLLDEALTRLRFDAKDDQLSR